MSLRGPMGRRGLPQEKMSKDKIIETIINCCATLIVELTRGDEESRLYVYANSKFTAEDILYLSELLKK